jgi:hypothetical protein
MDWVIGLLEGGGEMFAIDCHVHGTRVLIDWSRIEGAHDSPEGPVLDWHCWCGARGRLIAGVRSEPREIELIVVGDVPRSPTSAAPPDKVAS